MKKFILLLLVLVLVLPVSAAGNLVNDGENLLSAGEVLELEQRYAERYTRYTVTADTRIPVEGSADTVAQAIREEFLI